MKEIKDYLNKKVLSKPPREKYFDLFEERLNAHRSDSGMKNIGKRQLGVTLSLFSEDELKALYQACREAKWFSRLFWYKVKKQREMIKEAKAKHIAKNTKKE